LQIVSSERQRASRRFDVPKTAILLALGEFTLTEIPSSRREPLLKQLSDSYRNDTSSGVHGAAGWLLRQWGQAEVVREVDQTQVPYSPDREWFTLAITDPLGPKRGSFRVFRGGGWSLGAANCRSGLRDSTVPSIRNFYVGFRLALSPSRESGVQGAELVGVGTEGAPAEQRPEMP